MSYDRYTKHTIRCYFPKIYQIMIQEFREHPALKGQVELSGLTTESLIRWAPEVIAELKGLADRNQIVFTASYYAAPVNACLDGNTHLRALRLGTSITRQVFGEIDGLFCQEESYTPQLPWIMQQLGIEWVSVSGKGPRKQPFILKGFDGSRVYGIPIAGHRCRQEFETEIMQVPDNSLFLFIGDYELYYSLTYILGLKEKLRSAGIELDICFVSDYLRLHPPAGEDFYEVCTDLRPMSSPQFSRWVSDPQDIRIHQAAMQAMQALRQARILNALAGRYWDQDFNESIQPEEWAGLSDLKTVDIEQPCEFSSVEQDFLSVSGQVRLLDRAEHLLVWGVNSDARGWYPLQERRWEHENSLRQSTRLSKEVLGKVLDYVGQQIELRPFGQPYLLYNSTGAREAWVPFETQTRCRVLGPGGQTLPVCTQATLDGYRTRALVRLPSYGYTVVYLAEAEPGDAVERMQTGCQVSSDNLSVCYKDNILYVEDKSGDRFTLELDIPQQVREITQDRGAVSRHLEMDDRYQTYTVEGPLPRLLVHKELDFGIHMIQEYAIETGGLRCRWRMDFSRPYLLGESDYFRADGITALARTLPGMVFYDSGYCVIQHPWSDEGYLAALQFAGIETGGTGLVILSVSGSQSFLAHGKQGELGICLGASTVGGPRERPDQALIDPGSGRITHFNKWDEEMFYGTYEHEFFILPFTGKWDSVAGEILRRSEPVYVHRLLRHSEQKPILPETLSLLRLDGPGAVLQDAQWEHGKLRLLLNEIQGKEVKARVVVGDVEAGVGLQAGELRYISVPRQ